MSAGSEYGKADGMVSLSATQGEILDGHCDRFLSAWKARERPRIEEHLVGAAGPLQSAILRELIAIELDARHRR
jgi:hypothetical protein